MSDPHAKSLHEELLGAFMHAAQLPEEIAATNEIDRLRKENAALKREIGAAKGEAKSSQKK
jgi:hypothetical protein